MDVRLLLIDPQVDFCDPKGALYVAGAEKDCIRTADMITRLGKKINRIYATFDSHSQYQIFHPMFWKMANGDTVAPFSLITNADVISGNITPVDPNMLDWAKSYTKALEDGGRYPLVIWPYHCLIGTPGWAMNPEIMQSIHQWERDTYRSFRPITKGSCFKTEHYSAVKAEVEVPEDPTTQLNMKGLIMPLEEADMVLIGGQARSHCVANTVRDIMANFSNDAYIRKLYILEDATSDVTTFEHLGDAFINDFLKAGGNITTTAKILA
jgi:nicotinamidase/pyrazinamidase